MQRWSSNFDCIDLIRRQDCQYGMVLLVYWSGASEPGACHSGFGLLRLRASRNEADSDFNFQAIFRFNPLEIDKLCIGSPKMMKHSK